MAGEGNGFLADAFHQAAVAGDHVGVVVDDVAAELHTAPQATFDALAAMAEVLDDRCTTLRSELVDALDAFDGKATRRAIRRVLEAPAEQPAGERTDALEGAAVRLEAGHPSVANALRAVIDALGKAGI